MDVATLFILLFFRIMWRCLVLLEGETGVYPTWQNMSKKNFDISVVKNLKSIQLTRQLAAASRLLLICWKL